MTNYDHICTNCKRSYGAFDYHTCGPEDAVTLDAQNYMNGGDVMSNTAWEILDAAGAEMKDRAATYDQPQGERSMGKTVAAFEAVTGVHMSEQQGWQFMEILKLVRSNQGGYRADSFIDGAAYAALAGEAAAREK